MEIILFVYGDASKASTWSNVPLCFRNALLKNNCIVHCVDISNKSKILEKIYRRLVQKPLNIIFPNHQYSYIRSNIFYLSTCAKICHYVRLYNNSDWCFFLNFDFVNRYSKAKSLLFGDWTFKILIEERLNRHPYFFEEWYIHKQDSALGRADKIVCLFPVAAKSMRNTYPHLTINHLGQNVINNLREGYLDEDLILKNKERSSMVLFIGGPKYLEAALLLKNAISIARKLNPTITLHIVGLSQEQLCLSGEEILYTNCYGYLNKDNEEQRDLYYQLMMKAKVFCNPSAVWAGYSSTIEAMFYYTPIITTKYSDFVEEFGVEPSFGKYIDCLSAQSLSETLVTVINNKEYSSMARNAHEIVADYSWDNYVKKLLGSLVDS